MTFSNEVARNIEHLTRCRKRGTRITLVVGRQGVEHYWEVLYCGTPIVRSYPRHNAISLFHNGFMNRTTKARMNHVLGYGTGGRFGPPPCPTRYHLYQANFQWYVRDEVSMTTLHWEGGRHLIISPAFNVGYVTDRIPSGWLNT